MFLILSLQNAVVIAFIGASAFITFTMPKNITARSRIVVCGHVIGMLSGSVCALIAHTSILTLALVLLIEVEISIYPMVAFYFEHLPNSGITLGIALIGFSPEFIITVLTSSLIFSLANHFSKKFFKDLV